MAYVPIRPKFLRGLTIPPAGIIAGENGQRAIGKIFKVLYEFWGFCVNGGNNLLAPGGFATSHLSGTAIDMPVGFESGSTVLIASGSDGSTFFEKAIFNSSNSTAFSPNVVGKYLTSWKSGSTSTEDSIYIVTKWINSSSICLDPTTGGQVFSSSGSVPAFTTRSDINWRITDLHGGIDAMSTWFNGQHMVLQFNDAPVVNPGQARSQAKIVARSLDNTSFFTGRVNVQLSPSGSWNGSTFVSESYAEIIPESAGSNGGWVDPGWIHGYNDVGNGLMTIIADKTCLILHVGGPIFGSDASGYANSLVIEIPERLYPQNVDPNPICASNIGNCGIFISSTPGYGWSHRFFPSPYDSVQRRWAMQTPSLYGTYWNSSAFSQPARYSHYFNSAQSKFMYADAILSCATVSSQTSSLGQYCVGRARVRSTRFCASAHESFMRVGDDNDRWIHVKDGIMWPWDHAIVPQHRLFRGS